MLLRRAVHPSSSTSWILSSRRTQTSPLVQLHRHHSASSSSSSSSVVFPLPPLIGSAPSYTRHLLINTPTTYKDWPSHIEKVSRLAKVLGPRWSSKEEGGVKGLGFAFVDASADRSGSQSVWSKDTEEGIIPSGAEEETYTATLYPDFLPITLSESTLPAFESLHAALPPISTLLSSPTSPTSTTPSASPTSPQTPIHIFICTHRTRDCRCGDIGEPIYSALVREVKKRKVGEIVKVSRVSHIGGHKYAGNALVYKKGGGHDWYGLLRDLDAPTLLTHALSSSTTPLYEHWRGSLGLTSLDVKEIYANRDLSLDKKKKGKARSLNLLGESVDLRFKTWDGEELLIRGYEGESLMDAATRADLPSILATCGGHAECATCHCHLPLPSDKVHLVPEISEEEEDQLDFAMGRKDDSRLACQIPITARLGKWFKEGGFVGLPRY